MIAGLVLAVRFACELAALGAIAWWGARVHVAAAIGLPIAAGILWWLWVAPRARRRLRDPARFAVESIVWVAAIASLIGVDRLSLAIGFGAVAFATAVAARRYEVSKVDGSSPGRA